MKKIALWSIILPVILYAGLCVTFFTDISKFIHINLLFRNIYIPVFGWICLALYALLWSRLSGEKLSRTAAGAIVLGFSVHISILLFKLNAQLACGSPLSKIYIYYIQMVTIVLFAALLVAAINLLRRIAIYREYEPTFFLPIVFLFFTLCYRYLKLDSSLVMYSFLAGFAAYYVLLYKKIALAEFIDRMKRYLSNDNTIPIIIFLLAFSVRFAFAAQMLKLTGGGSVFVDGSDDGRTYDFIGWGVASNTANLFKDGFFPSEYDPGYSLFLAAIYKIFGHNFYAVTFIQSIINGFIPVIVFCMAKMTFSKKIAIAAAIFASLDQVLIMHSVVLGTEALFNVLLLASFFYLMCYFKGSLKIRYLFISGLFLGLAVTTRYMLIAMPIFMFIASLFIKGHRLRRKMMAILIVVGIVFVVIMPITLLNYHNTGKVYLLEKSANRIDIVWYNSYVGRDDISPSNKRLVEIGFDPFKKPLDSCLLIFKKPVELMLTYGGILSNRCRNFFFWPNFGFSDPLILANPSRYPNEFGSTMEFYFFIIYLTGLWVIVRSASVERTIFLIFSVFAYFLFIHVVVFMFSTVRYRAPVIPYLAIIFSLGLYAIYDFVRRRLNVKMD